MKNLSETIKYLGKNFIFVFGFVLLPSFYIGGLLQPFSVLNFMVDYKNLVVNNFGSILSVLFGLNWVDVINWILATIFFVFIFSAIVGNIENHFKSGKLNPSSTMNFINNNFLSVCTYVGIFLLAYNLFKVVLGLMYFIVHILCGKLGSTPTMAMFVVLTILAVVVLVFMAYLFGVTIIAMVDTNICGYSVPTSYSDANDLMDNKVWQTIFLVVLPFVIIAPLVVCGHLFNFQLVSNIVAITIAFMYYPVMAYTVYFDYARINRYDNIKRYYY